MEGTIFGNHVARYSVHRDDSKVAANKLLIPATISVEKNAHMSLLSLSLKYRVPNNPALILKLCDMQIGIHR